VAVEKEWSNGEGELTKEREVGGGGERMKRGRRRERGHEECPGSKSRHHSCSSPRPHPRGFIQCPIVLMNSLGQQDAPIEA